MKDKLENRARVMKIIKAAGVPFDLWQDETMPYMKFQTEEDKDRALELLKENGFNIIDE